MSGSRVGRHRGYSENPLHGPAHQSPQTPAWVRCTFLYYGDRPLCRPHAFEEFDRLGL